MKTINLFVFALVISFLTSCDPISDNLRTLEETLPGNWEITELQIGLAFGTIEYNNDTLKNGDIIYDLGEINIPSFDMEALNERELDGEKIEATFNLDGISSPLFINTILDSDETGIYIWVDNYIRIDSNEKSILLESSRIFDTTGYVEIVDNDNIIIGDFNTQSNRLILQRK